MTDGRSSKLDSTSHSDDYHKPQTVEELTKQNVQTVAQLEESSKAKRTRADRIAGAIAQFCGSMTFVWVHVFLFGGWIIINLMPGITHIDPFPFQLLSVITGLEAIFLSTFILINQNYETRVSERRNHLTLQLSLLSEQENTKMLTMLMRIGEKVGAQIDDDPTVQVLEQATRPEKLGEQIEEAIKLDPAGQK